MVFAANPQQIAMQRVGRSVNVARAFSKLRTFEGSGVAGRIGVAVAQIVSQRRKLRQKFSAALSDGIGEIAVVEVREIQER